MNRLSTFVILLACLLAAPVAVGEEEMSVLETIASNPERLGITAINFKNEDGDGTYSVTLQILFIAAALTVLPSLFL